MINFHFILISVILFHMPKNPLFIEKAFFLQPVLVPFDKKTAGTLISVSAIFFIIKVSFKECQINYFSKNFLLTKCYWQSKYIYMIYIGLIYNIRRIL